MNKVDRFFEKYGKEVILETGEVVNVDELLDIYSNVKKEENHKKRLEGLKKLRALKNDKVHFSKEKEGRIFGMIYEFDY